MIEFIYQLQTKRRTGWCPVFPHNSSKPIESTDLEYVQGQALFYSQYEIRIVRIETHLIPIIPYGKSYKDIDLLKVSPDMAPRRGSILDC